MANEVTILTGGKPRFGLRLMMVISPTAEYSPLSMLRLGWKYRRLIARLARREIEARYRGSMLGVGWAVVSPLILLAVYTFVFSVIFKARWDVPIPSQTGFALVLFSGLILFNVFSECLTRAPLLILSNVSYVKKVVFPLEILPIVSLLCALVNAAISSGVFLVFYLIWLGIPPPSAALAPLAALPLLISTLGLSWFLSSVGVFIRDLRHVLELVVLVLMFLCPLFYPLSVLPERFRMLVRLNPLTVAIEQVRALLFGFAGFDFTILAAWLAASLLIAWLGFLWFMLSRRGFADVV